MSADAFLQLNSLTRNIFVVGVNHDTSPLGVRERLAFDADSLTDSYANFKSSLPIEEVVILSTCNRTEIYFCYEDFAPVVDWLSKVKGLGKQELEAHVYVQSDTDVLIHAASVASGMRSMLVGETQILGQMKVAYKHADTLNCIGSTLRKVFDTAFSIAKDVRTNTEIGAHSVSLASTSLRAIERIFPDCSEQNVLFIGAGEMIELFSQHFSERRFKSLNFSNRTLPKAMALADKYGGRATNMTDIAGTLSHYDIVVSCTGSPIPILSKSAFEDSLRVRRRKPTVVIDLAVPRDVELSVKDLDDIFLYTVDDLGELVRKSISIRTSALEEANRIISTRLNTFSNWLESDNSISVVKAFRALGHTFVRKEVEKSLIALNGREPPEQVLHRLANSLGNKFLDRPSRILNRAKGKKRRDLCQALINLFELDD